MTDRTRGCLGPVALLMAGLAVGCSDDGSKRFRVSGDVTFDGQPIPYGEVVFTPDGSKQNSGPQGIAPIRDGKFDTRSAGGQGVAGGPTIVRVNGMTGPGGQTLCEYELAVDIPRQDTIHPIAVPKPAAGKPTTAPEI